MKYIKYLGGFLLLTIICLPLLSQTKEWWKDVNNEYINAHGGGVLFHNGLYYWFGEHRPENGFTTEVGVNCYASSDLQNWTHKGVALAVSEEPGSDIERGCIMERPKVIYGFVFPCKTECLRKDPGRQSVSPHCVCIYETAQTYKGRGRSIE